MFHVLMYAIMHTSIIVGDYCRSPRQGLNKYFIILSNIEMAHRQEIIGEERSALAPYSIHTYT